MKEAKNDQIKGTNRKKVSALLFLITPNGVYGIARIASAWNPPQVEWNPSKTGWNRHEVLDGFRTEPTFAFGEIGGGGLAAASRAATMRQRRYHASLASYYANTVSYHSNSQKSKKAAPRQ